MHSFLSDKNSERSRRVGGVLSTVLYLSTHYLISSHKRVIPFSKEESRASQQLGIPPNTDSELGFKPRWTTQMALGQILEKRYIVLGKACYFSSHLTTQS